MAWYWWIPIGLVSWLTAAILIGFWLGTIFRRYGE